MTLPQTIRDEFRENFYYPDSKWDAKIEDFDKFLDKIPALVIQEAETKLKGLLMSEIDLAMFRCKSNNWDVGQREKYAREKETQILQALSTLK